jgi:hypothetical protein
MPKTRPPYPAQLRARLIELARTSRTPEELGRQFEPSAQTSSSRTLATTRSYGFSQRNSGEWTATIVSPAPVWLVPVPQLRDHVPAVDSPVGPELHEHDPPAQPLERQGLAVDPGSARDLRDRLPDAPARCASTPIPRPPIAPSTVSAAATRTTALPRSPIGLSFDVTSVAQGGSPPKHRRRAAYATI